MPNAGFTPVFPRSLGPGENLGYRSTLVLEEEDPPCKVLLFVLSMSLDCAALDSYITLQYHTMLSHISFFFFFFLFFSSFLAFICLCHFRILQPNSELVLKYQMRYMICTRLLTGQKPAGVVDLSKG